MPRLIDLAGRRFGRLTVKSIHSRRHNPGGSGSRVMWLCECDCGAVTTVSGDKLKCGEISSCGCWSREATRARRTTHGATAGATRTPEYRAWTNMINRCTRPETRGWSRYGGRGVKVCDRWLHSFEAFLADLGKRPGAGYSMERINNAGNYEPENCRWASEKEQARNRRSNTLLTYRGETLTIAEWCERTGLHPNTLGNRVGRLGWSIERALTTPAGNHWQHDKHR